jgi:hypothetical protein
MTFKALRHVGLDPSMTGRIVAAAVVVPHVEHGHHLTAHGHQRLLTNGSAHHRKPRLFED